METIDERTKCADSGVYYPKMHLYDFQFVQAAVLVGECYVAVVGWLEMLEVFELSWKIMVMRYT